MVTATSNVKFTNAFADGTTFVLTLGTFDPESVDTDAVKAGVIEFNQKIGDPNYPDFADYPDLMLSKTGAKWNRINRVQVITAAREYLF